MSETFCLMFLDLKHRREEGGLLLTPGPLSCNLNHISKHTHTHNYGQGQKESHDIYGGRERERAQERALCKKSIMFSTHVSTFSGELPDFQSRLPVPDDQSDASLCNQQTAEPFSL